MSIIHVLSNYANAKIRFPLRNSAEAYFPFIKPRGVSKLRDMLLYQNGGEKRIVSKNSAGDPKNSTFGRIYSRYVLLKWVFLPKVKQIKNATTKAVIDVFVY